MCLCLCVFVSLLNFDIDREAFEMYKFPHVSPLQSICTSLAHRTYCMLHPTLSFFITAKYSEKCKSWIISSCKLHPSSVTSSILGPYTIIYIGIILHSFVYLTYFTIFQNQLFSKRKLPEFKRPWSLKRREPEWFSKIAW